MSDDNTLISPTRRRHYINVSWILFLFMVFLEAKQLFHDLRYEVFGTQFRLVKVGQDAGLTYDSSRSLE